MKKRLLFVVNDPAFFVSHRLPVALGALNADYDVHVATMDGAAVSTITANGFKHHELPLNRSGKNLFAELYLFISVYFLFRSLRPDVVHLVTIKPVLYGGIAARLSGVKGVVAAVSGLGFAFMASGLKASVIRLGIECLYRAALRSPRVKVIFQNPDDRDTLLGICNLDGSQIEMIRGSGVSLSLYQSFSEPSGAVMVSMAARLLRDKGVEEFVGAARLLKGRGHAVTFRLIGDSDPGNPTSIGESELDNWRREGVVDLLGYRSDISEQFAKSHVVVLPSYREGLPKVLVEAAACGRAVVTTDVPGCRDAIEPGVTGLLVPVKNVTALADAIEKLVLDGKLRQSMGLAGRALAEREFDIEKVVQRHLGIYKKLEAES